MKEIIQIFESAECKALNEMLAKAILNMESGDYEKRSHFFHGRYENLYINTDKLPGMQTVLETALSKSAELLQQPISSLKLGFWLNIMNQGNVTTLHCHDDDDELLSTVYYIQVPDNSGVFRQHSRGEIHEIEPVAGRFMFFDPTMPHEVSVHQNDIPRISVGINIGRNE